MKEAFGPMRFLSGQGHSAQSCRNRNRAVDKFPAAYHSFSNAVEEMCLLWASSPPALWETLIALQMPGQEEQERGPNCPSDSYQAIAIGWPLV